MSNLTRWDPFREMNTLRTMLDRVFDESFVDAPRLWERPVGEWSLALDVAENEDEYTVKASLPGITPEDVEVTLADNVLTIRGEMKADEAIDEENYHLRERRFGKFVRSITLPTTVDADKVEAVNENGVLTLHLPKTEAVKPKKIEVRKQITSQ